VEEKSQEYLFEIACFLIYSAKGCFREPKAYGPLRLLQAFSLIAELPKHVSGLREDKFILKVKREIDENILREMDDEEFRGFVSKLSLEMGEEVKRRKLK
jgi:hypothetical protein